MADQQQRSEAEPVTNIVLVGRTGNGKSATGNTLVGETRFTARNQAVGVTMRCEAFRTALKNGPIINVIDTPGLFDVELDPVFLSKEIIKCLGMANDGIHAVLFVVSVQGRMSKEEEATLNALQRIFESKILDYFIVVFTGGDRLEADGITFDEYLGRGVPEFLKKVLRLCSGRKILLDNRTEDKEKKAEQLKQLLALIADVGKKNGGMPYTDQMHRKIKFKMVWDAGLFDSAVSNDFISTEIINCLTMAEEGIHAVLFVLSARDRVTQEEESTLDTLQFIFDSNILDYLIVVFTGGDELEREKQTLEDYLGQGCPEFLTRVLRLCGGRKVLFNNRTNDKQKKAEQLKQLLSLITEVEKQNGGKPYTDHMHRKLKEEGDRLREQKNIAESRRRAAEAVVMIKNNLDLEHDEKLRRMAQLLERRLKQNSEVHERKMRELREAHERAMSEQREAQRPQNIPAFHPFPQFRAPPPECNIM